MWCSKLFGAPATLSRSLLQSEKLKQRTQNNGTDGFPSLSVAWRCIALTCVCAFIQTLLVTDLFLRCIQTAENHLSPEQHPERLLTQLHHLYTRDPGADSNFMNLYLRSCLTSSFPLGRDNKRRHLLACHLFSTGRHAWEWRKSSTRSLTTSIEWTHLEHLPSFVPNNCSTNLH